MADQNSRWASLRQLLCCVVAEDDDPDPQQQQQQQLGHAPDNSDPESNPDQPVQIPPVQEVSQTMNLPRWKDRDEMYKRSIHDLEEELTEALKNLRALSHHLYEMGCLVFPEVDPWNSTSPSFVEELKVYLVCLQLERQLLEKRVLRAEQTIWEMQNEVSDLEELLHSCGYRGIRPRVHGFVPPPPDLSSQPLRYFFSKIHRKSPENEAAAESPGQSAEESFDEAASPKLSPLKKALAKSSWSSASKQGSTEAESCAPLMKRDIFAEHRLPQTIPRTRAGSYCPPPEYSSCSTARTSLRYGDTYVAQAHGQWGPLPNREQEDLSQGVEDDHFSSASALVVAPPSSSSSEDIKIFPDSSISLQRSKMENCRIWLEKLRLAAMEGDGKIQRQGEGSRRKEEERVTLGNASRQPGGLAGQVSENFSDAWTNPPNLDNPEATAFQDPSGHATLQAEISCPGTDSPKSGQSQSNSVVHSSNQTADQEPEQASCSLDLLQKPGQELSSLEPSLKADFPASSIKALETEEPLGVKRVLEDATGPGNENNQAIPMEENTTVACPPQLTPGELLPSHLCEAFTNISLESPPPASLVEESPSSLAEGTAVEDN